jgi:hypothetical protein
MDASDVTATRHGCSNRPLVLLALVTCAWIGLSAGHAIAGLSPGQACAVKKLKASEQAFKSAMKCEESLISGAPPGPCLQAAGERLTEAFQKLEAKDGCVTTHDDLPVRSLLVAAAVHIGILLPGDPPCTTPGQACGACGGGTQGTCLARFPNLPQLNLGNACVVEESCSDIVCIEDSDCPVRGEGEACVQTDPTVQGGRCCSICSGCYDNNPCTQDVGTGIFCLHLKQPDGIDCSDGNVCNGFEECQNGTCAPAPPPLGTPLLCADNNPCTADFCDPLLGCVNDPAAADGDSCGIVGTNGGNGHCFQGLCQPNNP